MVTFVGAGAVASDTGVLDTIQVEVPTHSVGDLLILLMSQIRDGFTKRNIPSQTSNGFTNGKTQHGVDVADGQGSMTMISFFMMGDGVAGNITADLFGGADVGVMAQVLAFSGADLMARVSSTTTEGKADQQPAIDINAVDLSTKLATGGAVRYFLFRGVASTEADHDSDGNWKGTSIGYSEQAFTGTDGHTFAVGYEHELGAAGALGISTYSSNGDSNAACTMTIVLDEIFPDISHSNAPLIDTMQGLVVSIKHIGEYIDQAELQLSNSATPGAGTIVNLHVDRWGTIPLNFEFNSIMFRAEEREGNIPISDTFALGTVLYPHIILSNGQMNLTTTSGWTLRYRGASVRGRHRAEDRLDLLSGNKNVRLRMAMYNPGANETSLAFKVRYSKNSGAYADITGASSNVQLITTIWYVNGDDVINQLVRLLGELNWEEIELDSNSMLDTSASFTAAALPENGLIEVEISLNFIAADLSYGDTLDFRIFYEDNSEINEYLITPRMNITKGVGRPPNNPHILTPLFVR